MRPNIMLATMPAMPPRRQHKRWAQGIELVLREMICPLKAAAHISSSLQMRLASQLQ